MNEAKENSTLTWPWLVPILLVAYIFECGFTEGLGRFGALLHTGSLVLFVGIIVAALLSKVILKKELAIYGSIFTVFSAIELINGNTEAVFRALIYGGIVGPTFGLAIALVTSNFAVKVRVAESNFFAKIKRGFHGRK